MPGWSPEIANEFIRIAAARGRMLDQIRLQHLVYIAHGWCLALHGEPLTGDRPEAWKFGPVYRRLADALARYGLDPVCREISNGEIYPGFLCGNPDEPAAAPLEAVEREVIARTYEHYGELAPGQLSACTGKHELAPWAGVFAGGAGLFRDIDHKLIKAQFAALAAMDSLA